MQKRYRNCSKFIAYFQPATNTYAPVNRLRPLYEEALSHPQVVGLTIGTRSDCVPEEVLELLSELAQRAYVSVEFGMQTMHDRSLEWMNRGHDHQSFLDAVERSRGRGFEIGAHVMLGLPGESHEDMLATARELARINVDAVKIHNLYCVKNTRLAELVAAGEVTLMQQDDYVQTVVDFIELLPTKMVIDRVSGDAPPDYFIGPAWCLDKPTVKRAILAEFERRDSWQGKRRSPTSV
jgi:radical SAM protein (TIGR01212 family)